MSYDLYLLPLPDDATADDASTLLESTSGDNDATVQQAIVDALMALDSRLVPFERNYAAIAEFEGTSIEVAKRNWSSTELNGPEDASPPLAQFQISGDSACIHWYSGTSPDEMQRYLETICRVSGFAVYDPQDGTIHRYT